MHSSRVLETDGPACRGTKNENTETTHVYEWSHVCLKTNKNERKQASLRLYTTSHHFVAQSSKVEEQIENVDLVSQVHEARRTAAGLVVVLQLDESKSLCIYYTYYIYRIF